jgi:hypothetical protein
MLPRRCHRGRGRYSGLPARARWTLALALLMAPLWQVAAAQPGATQTEATPGSAPETGAATSAATAAQQTAGTAPEDGCTCLWQGSFVDVQADTDVVVAGTIVERRGNSVDLAVERTLRGEAHREHIRIWLKARDYCRPEAEGFPPGSRWVMALTQIHEVPPGGFDQSTPNISYGRPWDYILSSCGGYWLSLGDTVVTGNLIDAPRWARETKMTPVLLDLLAAHVRGEVDREAIRAASREDPALREMLLDTKAFLRESREP